jgi:hypothetical protein
MSGVAKSVIGGLGLGGVLGVKAPKAPKVPKAPPPAPRISGADASGRRASGRLKRRKGLDSTVLTFGLGKSTGVGTGTGSNLLGGST